MRSIRTQAALILALPALAGATGSVVVFPAIGRPTLVTVAGRALETDPEAPAPPLQRNVRRLTAKSREGAAVSVDFAGQTRRTTTDGEGRFEVSFPAPAQAPFPLGLQPVRAEAGGARGQGSVEVISDAAPFVIVSDFDDTLAVSNVRTVRGVLSSGLLEDEREQRAVEGMAAFYRCLREGSDPKPGFTVVSGSPLEYAPRLAAFLDRNGFPFAALQLRRLGPRTLRRYKEPVLRALLSRFPQPVLLVGDSGERDPEVYAAIRDEFPGRVRAIFIRDVGRSADPARFDGMVLFRTPADAARAAAARGLLAGACVDRAFGAATP